MEGVGQVEMQQSDPGSCQTTPPRHEVRTPSENDLLITRLVARIAELEEKLYKKELEAPAIAERAQPEPSDEPPEGSSAPQPQQLPQTPTAALMPAVPRLRDSFLATLRESWAKLEATAVAGGAVALAVTAPVQLPAPVPMRPLDSVATPTKASAASTMQVPAEGAAPAAAPPGVVGKAASGGGGEGGGSDGVGMGAGEAEPANRALSAEDLKAGSFNFSTHLVVDYTKPTGASPASVPRQPGRQIRRKPAGNDDGKGADSGVEGSSDEEDDEQGDEDDDDDDTGSLSSVDSSGMGYEAAADEDERERRTNSRANSRMGTRPPSLSGSAVGPGSVPSTPGGSAPPPPPIGEIGGGGGGGASGRRPPLPPLRPPSRSRGGSDGGSGPPSSISQQQSGGPQPSQPSGSAGSRAAAWSKDVLSKLGLPWGRDRGGDARQGGAGLRRNNSGGNLLRGTPSSRAGAPGEGGAFSDRALEEQIAAGGGLGSSDGGGDGRYYRYVFDPADVQAEMEVTARVRRAAAEALMEANAKLASAQAAAAALQQQVEQAKQLEQELEALRAERAAAQATKASLEFDMAMVRRQLECMKDTESSLQAELESVRSQADIWRSSQGGEAEKLKQENTLLRNQLSNRLSELQSCRARLSDGESERQRLHRDAEELRNKIQWLTKINLQLETAASQLNDARRAAAEWQERFMRERNVRRRLHDQLQQLRGNIQVVCRVRPALAGQQDIVTYPLEGLLGVSPPEKRYQEFEFDHVFSPETAQSAVFAEAVAPLVRSVADGFNGCVFAFGQTGSGKSHTMLGSSEDPGVYVRALQELFRIATEEDSAAAAAASALLRRRSSTVTSAGGSGAISAAPSAANGSGDEGSSAEEAPAEPQAAESPTPPMSPGVEAATAAAAAATAAAVNLGRYSFQVAMLEVYNEAVYDCLAPAAEAAGAAPKPLEVLGLGPGELPPGHERVPGLTWRPVSSTEAVEALLREGSRHRATAALNTQSGRAHLVVSVRVTVTAADGRRVDSHLHMIDLAGSERTKKTEMTSQRSKECQAIGRSLSALSDVISGLQRRGPHIPFRNSKLTAVLQDSMCGNSKVLVLCNIAPDAAAAGETLCSLNFASRVAQVELSVGRRSTSADRARPSANPHQQQQQPAQQQQLPRTHSSLGQDRDASSSGGGSATGGGRRGGSLPSSPLPAQPPLPIMNGTAAKVRAAAAAAAAAAAVAAASSSGGGGGAAGSAGSAVARQSQSSGAGMSGAGASSGAPAAAGRPAGCDVRQFGSPCPPSAGGRITNMRQVVWCSTAGVAEAAAMARIAVPDFRLLFGFSLVPEP